MADTRKSTQAYARASRDIPLHTNLPQGGRKNQNKKKVDINPTLKPRCSTSVSSQYQPVVGREFYLLTSESKTTRLLGGIFSTPVQDEIIYQDKDMSPMGDALHRLDVMAKMNHRFGYKIVMEDPFNPRIVPYMETNLIDYEDPIDSEATAVDPKEVYPEIGVLNKWVAEEEAKHAHLEKERDKATLNSII